MSGRPVPSQLDQVLPRFSVQKPRPYHPFGRIRIALFGKGLLRILGESGYTSSPCPEAVVMAVPFLLVNKTAESTTGSSKMAAPVGLKGVVVPKRILPSAECTKGGPTTRFPATYALPVVVAPPE